MEPRRSKGRQKSALLLLKLVVGSSLTTRTREAYAVSLEQYTTNHGAASSAENVEFVEGEGEAHVAVEPAAEAEWQPRNTTLLQTSETTTTPGPPGTSTSTTTASPPPIGGATCATSKFGGTRCDEEDNREDYQIGFLNTTDYDGAVVAGHNETLRRISCEEACINRQSVFGCEAFQMEKARGICKLFKMSLSELYTENRCSLDAGFDTFNIPISGACPIVNEDPASGSNT
ncbi:unnamed protein product [Amoebophrya sp. A25]|nr:unnamed protein product [Amoebophrya sp. A25]|eukprot:GSA25T00009291001.1